MQWQLRGFENEMQGPSLRALRLSNRWQLTYSPLTQKLTIRPTIICGPRLEAPLFVELVREINIRLAVQEVTQIHPCTLQVNRVDLEIAPIERAIRIVMVDLARAARVFGTLTRSDMLGQTCCRRIADRRSTYGRIGRPGLQPSLRPLA